MYIAVTYIGGKYIPGEAISEDVPKEKLDWLIRAGAVRKAAPVPAISIAPPSVEETPAEVAQGDADSAGDAAESAAEDATEDEIDEDAIPPEIDVMAGIVQNSTEEPSKPVAKRKAATNTSGKKTPKGGKTK